MKHLEYKKARQSLAKNFFTLHYYLLLAKIDKKRRVKSEELIVKK